MVTRINGGRALRRLAARATLALQIRAELNGGSDAEATAEWLDELRPTRSVYALWISPQLVDRRIAR